MKKPLLLCFGLLIIVLAGCFREKETALIDLKKEWKFKPGDDPAWSQPGFNDSTWSAIIPGKTWERQGYKKLDGYAWYRIKVTIPSSIQNTSNMKDSLQFLLGKIDDCDQVFLNGKLIGENGVTITGSGKPCSDFTSVHGLWDTPRRYVLSITDPRILWDKENVIAVRVFDFDGPGGMFSEPFCISMTGLKDYLTFDFTSTGYEFSGDTMIGKKFNMVNHSLKDDFSGVLDIKVISCDNGNILFRSDTLAAIPKGDTVEFGFLARLRVDRPVFAMITFTEGSSGATVTGKLELPYILTPASPKQPRINGAKVFGVRPGSPFLFKVPATGEAPLKYFATGLPETLTIDEATGIISGYIPKKGTWNVTLCVENSLGHQERDLRIECGDLISLTPPLGWNSWNCWGLSVSDELVRQSADYMKSSGLIDHGWTYINIDDGWEDTHVDSVIRPNSKFPDMNAMTDYVHSLGLKVGIYSSPGPKTCGGYEGSYRYEFRDAWSYARWGIDYLKYDWCSYYQIAPEPDTNQMKYPYQLMKRAIRSVPRDIHFSLCQYGMGEVWKWGATVDGNSWRTTGDITDTWESMSGIGFNQGKCSPYAGPGRWNDPDMLVVGWVGWGPSLHYTNLTPNEQYTHITLWSMLASPLLIGCDLSRLDPFTLNLLTNDEVLAVNQDPAGRQAVQVQANESWQIWKKEMEDSTVVVGLFNLTEDPIYVPVNLKNIPLEGKWHLRDVWSQKCLGKVENHIEVKVLPHGARMLRFKR
ncbi:MAG TPA: putative Ig domain-containing protein [Bacteroidales bacterium]|nr:putative Ig domain-containing protein [Bacteroidales bacterium]